MVGMVEISSALTSLKLAKDMTETMIGLRDASAFQEKRIELQSKIIDAQVSVFAAQEASATLIETIRDLKEQIAGMETWEAQKQRYELKEVSSMGSLAYVLKQGMQPVEPPHCICTDCYERRRKSILQATPETDMRRVYMCPACKSKFYIEKDRIRHASP